MTPLSLFLILHLQYYLPIQDAAKLVCIAEKESLLNPKAINHMHNTNGTKDFGLFQINSLWKKELNLTKEQLLDVNINIATAVYIYNKQGLKAWSTHKRCL